MVDNKEQIDEDFKELEAFIAQADPLTLSGQDIIDKIVRIVARRVLVEPVVKAVLLMAEEAKKHTTMTFEEATDKVIKNLNKPYV